MLNFDFVSDEKFRFSLEKDYQELTSSLQNGAWKAAHLLAGSIIEAILMDYLSATGYQHTDLLSMTLEEAISVCGEKGALSDKVEYIAYTIKDYKNLIHPDKVMRLSENIEEGNAKVSQALVDIITKEIAEAKKKLYGYTAEQIVNKIIKDSSTNAVLPYLLKNTSEFEKKRLLVEVIPQKYIDYLEKTEPGVSNSLSALAKSFYIMFNTVSDQTKKDVAQNFVKIIQDEKAYQLYVHQNQFFKGHFLAYLNAEDAQIVKKSLFLVLEEQVSNPILKTLEGIGEFLQVEDAHSFISPIILSTFKEPHRPSASLEDIGEFLCEEYPKMSEDVKDYIRTFLNEDRWSFRNDNDKERLTYLRNFILSPRIWTNRLK
ncbi:MAG TPA: hypothetical protein VGL94_12570 [Ktedonobacteraceae bacterium]|jgi:hypothetical protein